MFPSKPLVDLASYNSNNTTVLFLIIGLWCFGCIILYVRRKGLNDAVNFTAFMAVITPTLLIGLSSGISFWSLVLMTVVNFAVWIYHEVKSDSNTSHIV